MNDNENVREAMMNQAAEVRSMDLLHGHAKEMAALLVRVRESFDAMATSDRDLFAAIDDDIRDLLKRAGLAS